MNKPIILIDNGHGAETPGKRSPDGKFLEYQYTREIAERVAYNLRARGYDARRIVPETEDVPLATRVKRVNEICNQVGAANVLLVSIHVNAAGNGTDWMKARGWSAYTSKGDTKSDELATCLYDVAEQTFVGHKIRKETSDGDPDFEDNFYIIQKTKCVAVLTENFFQDNKDDVAYLASEQGKANVVWVHVQGIIQYLVQNE